MSDLLFLWTYWDISWIEKNVKEKKRNYFRGSPNVFYADRLHYKNFTLFSKCVYEWEYVYVYMCVCISLDTLLVSFFAFFVVFVFYKILTTFEIFTDFFYQKYISFHVFCLHSTSILPLFMHLLHFFLLHALFVFFKIHITFCFLWFLLLVLTG